MLLVVFVELKWLTYLQYYDTMQIRMVVQHSSFSHYYFFKNCTDIGLFRRSCRHHGHHEVDGHSRRKKNELSTTLSLDNHLEYDGSTSTRSRSRKSSSAALLVDGSRPTPTTVPVLVLFLAAGLVCVDCGSGIVVHRIICPNPFG